MCDITQFGVIGLAENTRLLDVVDEMSRDDWWVRPWKNTPSMLTTAAMSATNSVFNKTDTTGIGGLYT